MTFLLKDRARYPIRSPHFTRHALARPEVSLAKTIELKPEERSARAYVDRLILEKLTEMESAQKLGELADKLSSDGVGLAAVKSLIASNPDVFAYHERRWVPAARISGMGRPYNEAIRLVLDKFGGPMALEMLLAEVGRIREEDEEDVMRVVERVLAHDSQFLVSPDDRVSLYAWAFDAHDQTQERALAINGVTLEEAQAVQAKLGPDFDWRDEDAVAKAVAIAAPVKLKVLGAVCWMAINGLAGRTAVEYDAAEFYLEATGIEGFVYSPDGTILPAADAKKWIAAATKIADKLAPTVEMEDSAPIEIKSEDTSKMVKKIVASGDTVTATKLLEEFYEITPTTKTFPDDLTNIMAALGADASVEWVGGDRFRKAGDRPDYIETVPEPFVFVESGVKDDEGEDVDVELTDEGLSSSLRKLIAHPLAMDVLDEDAGPAPKSMPDNARLVLKSIHRELGTFPLAQLPTGWIDPEPRIQEAILMDPAGRECKVWINNETRLIYDLVDWWFEQPIESGAVFTLVKTTRPNVFEFEWMDQPDPVVYISSQRMEELRNLGLESEGKSTLQLLIEVMAHWPKGADYLTVLAEVNVARRSSRRLIASLLSSYQCFYQRSGSPVWHFDAKKVEQGFDKTKKKFIKK